MMTFEDFREAISPASRPALWVLLRIAEGSGLIWLICSNRPGTTKGTGIEKEAFSWGIETSATDVARIAQRFVKDHLTVSLDKRQGGTIMEIQGSILTFEISECNFDVKC